MQLTGEARAARPDSRVRLSSFTRTLLTLCVCTAPVIGGVLVASVGWGSIFFVNVPLVALGMWLTLRSITETPRGHSALDLRGQFSAIVMLGSLTAAVITAEAAGWTAPLVLALFAVAVVAGGAFAFLESRSEDVMLPLDLFRRPAFSAATIVGFVINFTLYGALFELGLYFQRLHGYSPLQTGLAFLPFCVSIGRGREGILPGRARGRR